MYNDKYYIESFIKTSHVHSQGMRTYNYTHMSTDCFQIICQTRTHLLYVRSTASKGVSATFCFKIVHIIRFEFCISVDSDQRVPCGASDQSPCSLFKATLKNFQIIVTDLFV